MIIGDDFRRGCLCSSYYFSSPSCEGREEKGGLDDEERPFLALFSEMHSSVAF